MTEEYFRLFIAVMMLALGSTYFHIQIKSPRYKWLSYMTLGMSVLSFLTAFTMLIVSIQNL